MMSNSEEKTLIQENAYMKYLLKEALEYVNMYDDLCDGNPLAEDLAEKIEKFLKESGSNADKG